MKKIMYIHIDKRLIKSKLTPFFIKKRILENNLKKFKKETNKTEYQEYKNKILHLLLKNEEGRKYSYPKIKVLEYIYINTEERKLQRKIINLLKKTKLSRRSIKFSKKLMHEKPNKAKDILNNLIKKADSNIERERYFSNILKYWGTAIIFLKSIKFPTFDPNLFGIFLFFGYSSLLDLKVLWLKKKQGELENLRKAKKSKAFN